MRHAGRSTIILAYIYIAIAESIVVVVVVEVAWTWLCNYVSNSVILPLTAEKVPHRSNLIPTSFLAGCKKKELVKSH